MAEEYSIIQFKRGTEQRWIEVNPILAEGEPGFVYDTNPPKLKIGDGIHHWNDLLYVNASLTNGEQEIIAVDTFSKLPLIGNSTKLYRVIENKLLYQWNSEKKVYESLEGNNSFDPSLIKIINGGKANG